MRKSAFYILIPLIILVVCLNFFLLDIILDWSLEHSLETVVGAKVEINKLHFNLRELTLNIGRLQIANPQNTWRNLIETGGLKFQLLSEPLYYGKLVIEDIEVNELMLNTPRKTNGKLRRKLLPGPFGDAQARLNRDIAAAPILDFNGLKKEFSPDKILADYHFSTNFSAKDIHADIENSKKRWDNNLKSLEDTKEQLEAINQKIAALQKGKTSSLPEIKEKISQAQEIQRSIAAFQKSIDTTGSNLKNDFSLLSSAVQDLKKVADGDFRALLKLAQLPDFESTNFAEIFFGESLLNESTVFINLMDKLQEYAPVSLNNPPKEKHPRGGQDITFPGRRTYPRLLIKKISVSGRGTSGQATQGYFAKGVVKGITNEPLLYGLPLEASLYGKAPNQATLDLNGRLNQASTAFDGAFSLKLDRMPLPEFSFPDNPYLPAQVTSGKADVDTEVNFKPDYFKLNLTLNGRNLIGDYSSKAAPQNLGMEIIRSMLSKIDLLTINYQLEGINKSLKMKIASNVNSLLAERFQAAIGEKVAQLTKTFRERVDRELKERQQELESLRSRYEQELLGRVNEVQNTINLRKQELEKKQKELRQQLTNNKLPFQLPKL